MCVFLQQPIDYLRSHTAAAEKIRLYPGTLMEGVAVAAVVAVVAGAAAEKD